MVVIVPWSYVGPDLADSASSNRSAKWCFRPNAAICDFHNDGPTPCEEANRRIFIDPGFNVSYILPFG
jgi:hypothetical protein